MEHPHLESECTLNTSDGELCCDNVPRFRSPRLMDDRVTIEVTCMLQAHEIRLDELPDDTLETVTRRLFERDADHREEERERFLSELDNRDIEYPDDPTDIWWYVIELTEAEVRALEENGYPEAYQMSQSIADDTGGMWETNDDSDPRAMKISNWGLRNLSQELQDRAIPFEQADYPADFF